MTQLYCLFLTNVINELAPEFVPVYEVGIDNPIGMQCIIAIGLFIGIAPAIPIRHHKPKIRVSLSGERMCVCTLQGGSCRNHRTDLMSEPCVLPIIIY